MSMSQTRALAGSSSGGHSSADTSICDDLKDT